MAVILVEPIGPREFRVRVRDGGSETTHFVEIPGNFEAEHGLPVVAPETLVERSFEFLLEREPATSILGRFTLDEISRYFPVYPGEIARRLS
ncbi:MAG TPA: hypothetical protein VHU61_15075 [Solirubrobacteraceae bacterium]|jgi:hypothetical protein|nr:hypothetical protein [Solirubrobacteraceae bacterium]